MPIHGELVLNYVKSIQWFCLQLLKTIIKNEEKEHVIWKGYVSQKLSRYIIKLKTTATKTKYRTL